MILSGRDLRLYIEQKKLVIHPIDESQYQQNGIDLILDDVKDEWGNKPEHFRQGQFYLGAAKEYFEMPDDLMAFVGVRSTWARKGLTLPLTIIDAGFKGILTLELVYNKSEPCKVPYGERMHHLIFARTTGPCVPYAGKYQGQTGITAPRDDKQ